MIIDGLEKLYLAGFPLLQLFATVFPVLTGGRGDTSSALEFLPLMLTSVYCAIGLVWAFLRLSVIYIRQQY